MKEDSKKKTSGVNFNDDANVDHDSGILTRITQFNV